MLLLGYAIFNRNGFHLVLHTYQFCDRKTIENIILLRHQRYTTNMAEIIGVDYFCLLILPIGGVLVKYNYNSNYLEGQYIHVLTLSLTSLKFFMTVECGRIVNICTVNNKKKCLIEIL